MTDVARDLAHGARLLRQSPGFTAIVVTTLAVAIGATVTVFSTVDAWLLKPLRFPQPERLVIGLAATRERPDQPAVFLPFRSYTAWQARSRAFTRVSAAFPRAYLLTGRDEASTANGLAVTPDFFETLGVPALVGRTLSDRDVQGVPAVVLSHGLWARQFGESATVLETALTLNGVPHQIVGVMPREFDVRMLEQTRGFELWTLFGPDETAYGPDGIGPAAIVGRLRDGISIDAARSDVAAIHAQVEATVTPSYATFTPLLSSLQADNTRAIRATLITIGGAVGGLLLIACLNVGTLLLGRGLGRAREAAIRVAIGCSRARLIKQLLTEGALLCAIGGAAGLGLAIVATRLYVSWDPLGSLPPHPIGIDLRAAAVALAATTLAVALCGVWPALRVSAAAPVDALHSGGERGAIGGGTGRAQAVLLGSQTAVSVLLLVATALLVRTFTGLQREPLGFGPDGLTVVSLALPTDAYPAGQARQRFFDRLAARLGALPGVRHVSAGTSPPLSSGLGVPVRVSPDQAAPPIRINVQDVTREFFETLEIPVVAGRGFEPSDSAHAPLVAVINERAARALFGEPQRALGRTLHLGGGVERQVVGIVANTRSAFFNTLEWLSNPVMYFPAPQAFDSIRNPTIRHFELHVHVRSGGPLSMADVRTAVSSLDTGVAVKTVRTATDLVQEATRQPALRVTLLVAFAAGSLLLAAIGVYGIVGQAVAQRRREIGVRLALGASSRDVVRAVTLRVLMVATIGIATGATAAVLLGDAIGAVIYGVKPTDALSFAVAMLSLMAAAATAAFLPARRATRIDPATALRL